MGAGADGNVVLNGGWSQSQTQNTNQASTLKAKIRFVSILSFKHNLLTIPETFF